MLYLLNSRTETRAMNKACHEHMRPPCMAR